MAKLLHLSDELIILIASHIRKPSHMLQLALVSKKMQQIAIPHLYRNLTIHQNDYRPSSSLFRQHTHSGRGRFSSIRYSSQPPHANVLQLADMIRANALPAGQTVTRLTVVMSVQHELNRFQTMLALLLPQLSSLRDLSLTSVSDRWITWEHETFSFAPLAVALGPARHTLRSLSMHFSLDHQDGDGWTVGSLRHFSKLTYLAIQGVALLGPYGRSAAGMPSLDSILPPGLKCLRLHWCVIEGFQSLLDVLATFVKDSVRVSRKTEKIVVQLNAQGVNEHESEVLLFESGLSDLSEEAMRGGLDLGITLDWRKGCCWVTPLTPEGSFVHRLENFLR